MVLSLALLLHFDIIYVIHSENKEFFIVLKKQDAVDK